MRSLVTGTVVGGDFRVERKLASGGMGAVYVATQLSLERQCALKIVERPFEVDPSEHARLTQEARLPGRIKSAYVVQVFSAGFEASIDAAWIAMELLEGETLARRVSSRGPLSLEEARTLFVQLGDVLCAAHAAGVVHRDLKPENVFLSRAAGVSFIVKVLDFGIAKVLQEQRVAAGTQAMGTPLWMAPEQCERGATISAATDLWALALLAFFVLSGRSYWRSPEGSLPMLVTEILLSPLDPPSVRAAQLGAPPLPRGFDQWFERTLMRDPEDRPQDSRIVVRALLALVGADPDAISERPPPRLSAASVDPLAATERPSSSRTKKTPTVPTLRRPPSKRR